MKSKINTLSQLLASMNGQSAQIRTVQGGWLVDPNLLVEKEVHSSDRWNRPQEIAYIRALADSFKTGRDVPPLLVEVRDGTIYILDGARRHRGALLAIAEGARIDLIAVVENSN